MISDRDIAYVLTRLTEVPKADRREYGISDEMLDPTLYAVSKNGRIYGCYGVVSDVNGVIYFRVPTTPGATSYNICRIIETRETLIRWRTECVRHRLEFHEYISNVVSVKRFGVVSGVTCDISERLYADPLWSNAKEKYVAAVGAQHCVDVARDIIEESQGPCIIVVSLYDGAPYYIFRRDPAVAGFDYMIAGRRDCFEPFAAEFPMIA